MRFRATEILIPQYILLYIFVMQDDRYSKFIGKMAIVPMTYGRHVPIIADRVKKCFLILGAFHFVLAVFHDIFFLLIPQCSVIIEFCVNHAPITRTSVLSSKLKVSGK